MSAKRASESTGCALATLFFLAGVTALVVWALMGWAR